MLRIAVLLLITAGGSFWIARTVTEAKGPPGRVTISGGDLSSDVVIDRPDLVPIETTGFFENTGAPPTAYGLGVEITGETPYVVTIFELDSDDRLQQVLSEDYFPANSQHPDLLAQGGKLWKVEPTFALLLDGRIKAALGASTTIVPASVPSAGGPPSDGIPSGWAYALLAAGSLLLLGSAAAVAYSRRS